jgi:hypothetical protein
LEIKVYGDTYDDVVNLVRALRHPVLGQMFIEHIEHTTYARDEFSDLNNFRNFGRDLEPVERAQKLIVRIQISFSGTSTRSRYFKS